ncbi:polyketide cyclase [Cohnella kolymensis]|uniref:Polyketide cyclase n=1 Tax=Cohnella kolymensis TaxID=1590652 RepID=A0ABR4ZZS1_9BACL|nr:SRPBCC family protein [Cohnella kolymensis]KIL34221.1 polyketide cyclase [Cohnella kolymensis]
MTTFNHIPAAKAEMLIRKPVEEVFEAFIEPAVTTRFWFTKSSGRLEPGKSVRWDWEMYGVSTNVNVKEIEENKRILIEWEASYGYTTVEWIFTPRADHETYVTVTNSGFQGDGDDIVKQAIDSTEGFTIVLCGLKALLEHNIILNLVSDKYPDAHINNNE